MLLKKLLKSEEIKSEEAVPAVEEVAPTEAGSDEPSEDEVAEIKEFRAFKAKKIALEGKKRPFRKEG